MMDNCSEGIYAMKRYIMRFISVISACVIAMFGTFSVAFAQDVKVSIDDTVMITVDGSSLTRGVWPPGAVWNIATQGQYHYSGLAGSGGIYTNYKFKGKTWYHTLTRNTGQGDMKVTILKDYGYLWKYDTLATYTVVKGGARSYTVSGLNTNDAVVLMFDTLDSYHSAQFNGEIK